MSFLNHLFGTSKSLGEEMLRDEQKAEAIWQRHLQQTYVLEKIGYAFSPHKLKLPEHTPEAIKLCQDILDAIGTELITIDEEVHLGNELVEDIHEAPSLRSLLELTRNDRISFEEHYNALLDLLKIVHDELIEVLKSTKRLRTELDLLQAGEIAADSPQLLQKKIFSSLTGAHVFAMSRFNENLIGSSKKAKQMKNIARMIIIGKDLQRRVVIAADRFSEAIANHMRNPDSKHKYQKLAVAIIEEVATTIADIEDISERIEKGEKLLTDRSTVERIVRKLRTKYTSDEVAKVTDTFVRVAEQGGFVDFSDRFAEP